MGFIQRRDSTPTNTVTQDIMNNINITDTVEEEWFEDQQRLWLEDDEDSMMTTNIILMKKKTKKRNQHLRHLLNLHQRQGYLETSH